MAEVLVVPVAVGVERTLTVAEKLGSDTTSQPPSPTCSVKSMDHRFDYEATNAVEEFVESQFHPRNAIFRNMISNISSQLLSQFAPISDYKSLVTGMTAACGNDPNQASKLTAKVDHNAVAKMVSHLITTGVESVVTEEIEKKRKVDDDGEHKTELTKLSFGDVDQFFKGLDERIGRPRRDLDRAVKEEHCDVVAAAGRTFGSSDLEFTTRNYHITTTPRKEYLFVFHGKGDLDLGVKQGEKLGLREASPNCEILRDAVARMGRLEGSQVTQDQFDAIGLTEIEVGVLRLYTGPMYKVYNQVLRMVDRDESFKGLFTTTLHLISSGLIKLSKLQRVTTLYRGLGSGGNYELPERFLVGDSKGVRGGVELGFASCSTDRDVALMYCGGGFLFEISTTMVTRGASLKWVSFYPSESEVCFPPLVALEVTNKHHTNGATTVFEMTASSNPAAATIDKFTEERKQVIVELGRNLLDSLDDSETADGSSKGVLQSLVREKEAKHSNHFNDDRGFEEAIRELTEAKQVLQEEQDGAFDAILKQAYKRNALFMIQVLVDRGVDVNDLVKKSVRENRNLWLEKLLAAQTDTCCDLSGVRMTDEQVAMACKGLGENGHVQDLNLLGNAIKQQGGNALTQLLLKNRTIHNVDIPDTVAGTVANKVKLYTEINAALNDDEKTVLNLKGVYKKTGGASELARELELGRLANVRADRLDLSGSQLGSEGAKLALEAVILTDSAITALDFGGNNIGDRSVGKVVDLLMLNPTVLGVGFSKNGLSRCGNLFVNLITAGHVTWLDLSHNKLKDKTGVAIATVLTQNASVTSLNLSQNKLRVKTAKAFAETLKANNTLTKLKLSHNKFGPKGGKLLAEGLVDNSSLTTLSLRGCAIKDKSGKFFGVSLEKNSSLTRLNIADNKLGDGSAKTLASCLRVNSTLIHLDFGYNSDMTDVGGRAVLNALAVNHTILTLVVQFSFSLEVTSTCRMHAQLNKAMADNSITELLMSASEIDGVDVGHHINGLIKKTNLTTLKLAHNPISNGGLVTIGNALESNTQITELDLSFMRNEISESAAQAFVDSISKNTTITKLKVRSSFGPEHSTPCLVRTRINEAILDPEMTSLSLAHLVLDNFDFVKFLKNLAPTNVNDVDMTAVQMTEKSGKALAEALKTDDTLTSLNISDNVLLKSKATAKAFSDALKENTTLTCFQENTFPRNYQGLCQMYTKINNVVRDETVTSLALQGLSLDGPEIAEEIKGRLVDSRVTSLDLSHNALGDKAGKAIAEVLIENTVITSLDLSDNKLGDDASKALAEMLKFNSTLTHLNLSSNKIKPKAAMAIAEVLNRGGTKRMSLNLGKNKLNNVTTESIRAMSQSLDNIDLYV